MEEFVAMPILTISTEGLPMTGRQIFPSIWILNRREKDTALSLMKAILHLAETDGYRSVISIITETNKTSLAFHEKFGFQKMAYFPSLGLQAWTMAGRQLLSEAVHSKR
jgi:L-amino acid N-acyltransferase YncA